MISDSTDTMILPPRVKRWDGNARITSDWDGLHKDSDLWFEEGDCFVHLYGAGQSQRGPSFCLKLATIKSKYCGLSMGQMFGCSSRNGPSRHYHSIVRRAVRGTNGTGKHRDIYDLYLPAPTDNGKGETFKYHLVSRNIFAWMSLKPVVGTHLGQALIALLERLNNYRSNEEVNTRDILAYMSKMRYLDFRECPDHALAVLQFAEHFQMANLWADAFAHCTGMNENLQKSTEFELVSRASKTFIQRAVRDLRLRLKQAADDLSTFFHDRLSGTYLGLSVVARDHLDMFRSFLHTFYLGKYGCWPPLGLDGGKGFPFPKETYRSLYFDFRCLYEYLVDMDSTASIQNNKLVSGGLCVLQNVSAFDRRNGYQTLLHPLPLLPVDSTVTGGMEPSWVTSLRPFGPARNILRAESRTHSNKLATVRSLVLARNNRLDLMTTAIVQEYSRFEKVCTMGTTEKVSAADGRKVRWLLIYTILQTLVSINEAPPEVKQTDPVPYPLCCRIPNLRPWDMAMPSALKIRSRASNIETRKRKIQHSPLAKRVESTTNLRSRKKRYTPSVQSIRQIFANTARIQGKLSENSKTVVVTKKKIPAFCEIIVYGYGNGLNQTTIAPLPTYHLERREIQSRKQHREPQYDCRLSIKRNPTISWPPSERSAGLTDDNSSRSSRNSTGTITTITTATAATDITDRSSAAVSLLSNSYSSLIPSNPYESLNSSLRTIQTDEKGKQPARQAIHCP